MQHEQRDGGDATETASGIGSTGVGADVKDQDGQVGTPGDGGDDADTVTGGPVDGESNVAGSAAGSGSTDADRG